MLKAITFDLWTTLVEPIDYREARIEYIKTILDGYGYAIDRETLRSAYSYALDRFIEVWHNEQRHMKICQRLSLMFRRLSVNLLPEALAEIAKYCEEVVLQDPPPLIPGADIVLGSLHEAFRVGLICDSGMSSGRVMRMVLDRYGLLHYFRATVFSDELGVTKPHSRMFETALRRLGVEADEALHVGDLLDTDVAGAKAAGLIAVWFNRGQQQSTDSHVKPDFQVAQLSEIKAIVEHLRPA